jgi:outer membrane biosynthesis protein TonB
VIASANNGRPGQKPVVSSVKTKTQGALAIQGDQSSVDAKDSPEGRYNSAVYERVGLLWNSKLAAVRGIAGIGSVEVEFDIDPNGRVSNVRLVDPGKANPVLEDLSLSSIINAKLPAPPESMQREMRDALTGGKLRRKFTFTRL